MTAAGDEARPTDGPSAGDGAGREPTIEAAAAGPSGSAADRAARAAARRVAAEARAAHRGPMDLPLAYASEATVTARAEAAGEPGWLVADRLAGLARHAELPIETNRLYTLYVDLRAADLEDVAPYVDAPTGVTAGGDADALLPEGTDGLIEIREGTAAVAVLSPAAREAGVVLEPLTALLVRDPAGARSLLDGAPSLPADDAMAQLARATWTTGVHLHVPDGVVLGRPLVVRYASGVPGRATIARTFVTLGAGARAAVVEDLVPSGPEIGCAEGEVVPQALLHLTTEVMLGTAADLSFASLQDLRGGTVDLIHRRSEVGDGASLRWALAQVGGRISRTRVDNLLSGDGSSVEQVEIVFGSSDQLFDLTSYTRHVGKDTTADLLSKAVMLDRSKSYIKGLTTIDRPARGTDSFLGEFGMLLSKTGRSVTIPSLEIDQPDCRRAAHSSSVGPIDPNQLFYLESRGIDPDEARKFIVLGFLEPVVARVPLDEERERLREVLEAKWAEAGEAAGGGHGPVPAAASAA